MHKLIISVAGLALLSACYEPDAARTRQAEATRTMTEEADRQVGMPRITNFQERRFAREIMEARDATISTYAYIQSLDGKLHCIGNAVGYGLPYGVQFTAPEHPQYLRAGGKENAAGDTYLVSQAEPNGLYMPDNAEASWVRLVDPRNGSVHPVYVEERLTISPFPLPASIVATPCPRVQRAAETPASTPATEQ